jgi:hypothetical protein
MAKMQHAVGFCDKAKRLAFAAFLGDSTWIHTRVFQCCTIDTFFGLGPVISYAVLWTSRHFSTVWGESPKKRLRWALPACDFSHFKFFVEGG